MQLLLINPNTTEAITAKVLATARACAHPGTEIEAVTGRFGTAYISTRAASAIAAHATLDAFAEHGDGADAVLIACFGDPGLAALKEVCPVPVVGLAEASCLMASTLGTRFGIVTGGHRWGPMLEEFVAGLGLSGRLAGIETVAPTGAEIAAEPDRAMGLLAASCRTLIDGAGAEAVILAGAGLAGLAGRLQCDVDVPLVDSVEAGVVFAEAMARLRPRKARVGSHARPEPVSSRGLSTRLSGLLGTD